MPRHWGLREGWSSLLLLLLLVLTMTSSFVSGGLAEGLHIVPWLAVLGVLVGLAAARLRLCGLLAHLLGLALGVFCCVIFLSGLVSLPGQVTGQAVGPVGWAMVLVAKAGLLGQRLDLWLQAALRGEASQDALPFVVQMAALSWLMAFYGAWFVFRVHWVWGAILPPGLAIFLNVYYGPPRLLLYFMVFLVGALGLVVRTHVYQRERDWQAHHVAYDRQIGFEFLCSGAVLSLFVIALIWLVPRPQAPGRWMEYWQQLEGPWKRVQDTWNRLYASLSYSEQTTFGFGRTLALGGPVTLGTGPAMEVQALEGRYLSLIHI